MMRDSLVAVTREAFYAAIGALDVDVHPSLGHAAWDETIGYVSHWTLRDGRVIGRSSGRPSLNNVTYWLIPELVPQGDPHV
jgi:hypothetical protein